MNNDQMDCPPQFFKAQSSCVEERRYVIPSILAVMILILGIAGCHRVIHVNSDDELIGVYRVERNDWASVVTLRSDHTSHQDLIVSGKMIQHVDGKWYVENSRESTSSDEVVISPCLSLRDNPKDYPKLHITNSRFGMEVSQGFPIEQDRHSRMVLVIDEEEDNLEFIKQEVVTNR